MPDPGVSPAQQLASQTGSKTSGEAAGFARAAATRGPSLPSAPPKDLGKAPTYNWDNVRRHIEEQRSAVQTAATFLPPEIVRNAEGLITAGWNPSMALDPQGKPLPWGAHGWDPRGNALYGDPNDTSLLGDLKSWAYQIRSEFTNGTGTWEGIIKPDAEALARASESLKQPIKVTGISDIVTAEIGPLEGSDTELELKVEAGQATSLMLNKFISALTGTAGVGSFVGGVTRGIGAAGGGFIAAVNVLATGLERLAGTELLALREMGDKATYLPDVPDNIRSLTTQTLLGAFLLAPVTVYDFWRSVEGLVEGKWRPADLVPSLERNWQASRIFYSLWINDEKREQAIQDIERGVDPRVVAVTYEDPKAEMIGQMLHDPTILIGMVVGSLKAARALEASRITIASDEVTKVLKAEVGAVGTEDWVRSLDGAVETIYREGQSGVTRDATRRGLTELNAPAKRFVATRDGQILLGTLSKHFENNQAAMLEATEAMARMASGNQAERMLGIETAGRLSRQFGVPLELFWSPEGAKTGVLMRSLITDEAGKINPSATILKDIQAAAGDATVLSESATKRIEAAYEKMYPTVEQQVKQNAEYATMLAENPEKAAKYLLQHPAAATEVGNFTKSLSAFYNTLPRPIMSGMHAVQAAMYMVLSPGYFVRNHLQNTLHILVDRGPGEAFRAFTFGGKAAEVKLTKMLGYDATSLIGGFGKAGAEAPSIMRQGGLALSAKAEASAAAVVVEGAVDEALYQAARTIPMEELASFGEDDIRRLRYYLASEYDPDKALARFYESRGSTIRSLGDNLTDEEYRLLKEHRSLPDVENILAQAGTEDDIRNGMNGIRNQMDDAARREASGITIPAMSDAPEAEQRIMSEVLANVPGEAKEEAGLLAKRANASIVAVRDMSENAGDKLTKAQSQRIINLAGELQPGQDVMTAFAAGGENSAGARNWANIANQVNGEINGIKTKYTGQINAISDVAYRENQQYLKKAWQWSDLSRDYATAGDEEGLSRLWREIGIDGEMPRGNPNGAARQLRDALWQGAEGEESIYRINQSAIFAKRRDAIVDLYQQQIDEAAKLAGLGAEDVQDNVAKQAQSSLARAQILDQANLAGVPGLQPLVNGAERADLQAFAEGREVLGENIRNARRVIRANATAEEKAALAAAKAPSGAPVPLANRWFSADRQLTESVYLPGKRSVTGEAAVVTYVDVPESEAQGLLAKEQIKTLPASEIETAGTLRNPESDYIVTEAQAQARKILAPDTPEAAAGTVRLYRAESGLHLPGESANAVERRIAQRILGDEEQKAAALDLLIAPQGDEGLTATRAAAETRAGYKKFLDDIEEKVIAAFHGTPVGELTAQQAGELERWRLFAKGEWTKARFSAAEYAKGVRDFTLLSYPKRYGADLVAGTIFPYHFWYSRTYRNWATRLVQNPYLLTSYARYRQYIEKVHAGLPDWWKQNMNSNEVLGLNSRNPVWFNLEATLNPLYGITGSDFNDPYRRVDATSTLLDGLSKFGPGTWTVYSLALATAYLAQGKDDAAGRWAGRLTTATRTFRDITALLGLNKGKGIEIDPLVQIYSGGLTPYDRNQVAGMADRMLSEGYSEAEVQQAAYDQSGPIWDQMVAARTQQRSPGEIAGWLFGTGFKPRTESDIQLDKMWADKMSIQSQMPNLSPEERRGAWDELRSRYPFMDAVLLARKGGVERDQAYTYLVLGRVPPGMADDFARAVGIDYKLVNQFYDDPSALDNMALTDRNRFMAGIADIGAMLDVPPEATRAEWSEVRNRYGKIRTSIESAWGSDIYDKIDVYYGKLGDDQKSRDAAQAYLDANPEVSEALDAQTASAMSDPLVGAYYSSLQKIERYWKGRMYDDIEQRVGADIWDKWNAYDDAKLGGTGKEYWKAHPELQEYLDIRDAWDPIVASQSADFALRLPERESFRLRAEPKSLGQETIAGMQQQAYRLTRQEWEQAMGPLLTNLVQDYINGEDLPSAAEKRLTEVATNLGIPDNPLLVVELYQRSALAPAGP